MGGRHAMIHSVFGMRVNGAWGMVLKEKLRRVGLVAEASHVDDGILLSFAPGQVPPNPERLVTFVTPEEVDTLLGKALIGTPLFGTRFRQCAIRALFIPACIAASERPPICSGSRRTRSSSRSAARPSSRSWPRRSGSASTTRST